MKTIREIIQRVKSLYSKGVSSDDSRLSSRHIYSILKSSRSIVLKRHKSANNSFSSWDIQDLSCVELIKALPNECPCIPPLGCKILRSKYKIPRPLSVKGKDTIISVSSVNGGVIFSETTWETKKYKKGNKYTGNKPDYFIKNGYLYVTINKDLKIITLLGVFADPIEVQNFISFCPEECEDCNCNSYLDSPFPLEETLVSSSIELTLKELDIFFRGTEDISNNSQDTPPDNAK